MENKIILLALSLLLSLIAQGVADDEHRRDHRGSFNKDHIREELDGVLPEDQYGLEDEESMELHYFKIHDHDKNNKLDGLELGAAMTHYHDEDENGKTRDRHVDVTDNELFDLIMQTLKDDDLNDDGYVDFFEFTKAHRRGVPAAEEAASI